MAELEPGGPDEAELSESAQAELLDMCEQQFAQLEKLHSEIILCEPDFCQNSQEQTENMLMAADTELEQWQTMDPTLLAENSEVLLKAGKDEILKLCSELEMVASCCEAKRDKLRDTKELELKWLEENKQALAAAKDHVKQLQEEKEKISEHSVLQDTKVKIRKMTAYQGRLMECLGYILDKHVPPPPQRGCGAKKTTNAPEEMTGNLISLNEILELLMNKVLNTPHDPYVTIDSTFWPPYIELILRYGIAVRHQENKFKIRLETFF